MSRLAILCVLTLIWAGCDRQPPDTATQAPSAPQFARQSAITALALVEIPAGEARRVEAEYSDPPEQLATGFRLYLDTIAQPDFGASALAANGLVTLPLPPLSPSDHEVVFAAFNEKGEKRSAALMVRAVAAPFPDTVPSAPRNVRIRGYASPTPTPTPTQEPQP